MRRACAAIILLLAVLAAPASAQPAGPEPEPLGEERALFAAMHGKDAAALERLLAPDFVLRGSPDIDRATWLSNALDLCWGERFDIDGADVRITGPSAVVSFRLTFYQDPATCQPATLRSLITDVWIRRDAGWQLSVRHSGPVGGGVGAQFAVVPDVPPRLAIQTELSYVATGGNASTSTLGLASDVEHRLGPGTTTGRFALVSSRADDVEKARSLTVQGRHGRALSPRLELLARGGYLRDLFAGLEHRTSVNAGVAYTASALPRALKLDAAIGGVFESRLNASDRRFVSAIVGATFDWKLRPGTEFHVRAEETSNLESAGDWRLANDASLLAALNGALSARLALATRYVHQPVPGFRRTDTQLTASLVLRLVRRPR